MELEAAGDQLVSHELEQTLDAGALPHEAVPLSSHHNSLFPSFSSFFFFFSGSNPMVLGNWCSLRLTWKVSDGWFDLGQFPHLAPCSCDSLHQQETDTATASPTSTWEWECTGIALSKRSLCLKCLWTYGIRFTSSLQVFFGFCRFSVLFSK